MPYALPEVDPPQHLRSAILEAADVSINVIQPEAVCFPESDCWNFALLVLTLGVDTTVSDNI